MTDEFDDLRLFVNKPLALANQNGQRFQAWAKPSKTITIEKYILSRHKSHAEVKQTFV